MPRGPDAKDCFPFLGGWALPARRKFQAPAAREGVDPATPCDHIPAAQTRGIKGFLSLLLLSRQRKPPRAWRRDPLSFGLLRSAPSLPRLPSCLCCSRSRETSPRQGTVGRPHQGLAGSWMSVSLGGGKNLGLVSSGIMRLLFGNFLLLRACAPRTPNHGNPSFCGSDLWLQDTASLKLFGSKSPGGLE